MNELFCYKSKKGIVFLSKSEKQNLFSIKNNIVAVKNFDYDLSEILKNADFFIKDHSLQDFIQCNYLKNQDIYIGNYHRGFNLLKQTKGTNYFSRIDDFDFNTGSINEIQSKISSDFSNGFNFSYCNKLEEMLEYVYILTKKGDNKNLQFGFIDKYDAKVLFSENVEFLLAPKEYSKKGKLFNKKFEINSEFHNLLVKSLDATEKLIKKKPKYNYKKSFFSLGKKLLEKEINDSRKDTKEIIEKYLDYNHGIIQRHTINGFLEDMYENIITVSQPKQYNPKKRNIQQILDKEFLPKNTKSVILRLSDKNYSKNVQDMVYSLKNELGMYIQPLNNIPCLTITGDTKDVNKFYNLIGNKKYSKFSKSTKGILSTSSYIQSNHAFVFPELLSELLKGNRNVIIPFSNYNNNDVLWNLQNIKSIQANEITKGANVNLAVLDTGCDYTHSQIKDNFDMNKLGFNSVYEGEDPIDRQGHGTHVAGTIAGNTTGVAPETNLFAVKVLDDNGSGSLEGVLRGVDWCISNNIQVMNLSLGSKSDSTIEKEMFDLAYSKGLITCAAAGNDGYGAHYPSGYESVISVTAVDRNNDHAEFSNIYYMNNISAPGVGIQSSIPNEGYGTYNGTSMATPHIAGVCALISSVRKSNLDIIKDIFDKTALKLGNPNDPDNHAIYGCGLVQADKSVK